MLGSTIGNPLKRSRNLSGFDIDELENVNPPTKRSKTWRDHTIDSKSTFPKTATRIIYPLPKLRGVLQAAKPSFAAPAATRTEARRAAVDAETFQIHEDTADEEMGNMLTHSANALDISGDETQLAAKMDRGKENVPPTDDSHAVAPVKTAIRAPPRMAIKRTKPRTPLGSLNIADFYPPQT
ncbi:hypothetical protein MMC29_006656 [Sticta canariensis]|nr:hypothetical protein [Sticta canariensis]